MSEKEIAEIEEKLFFHPSWATSKILIATVKELRKENTEQRELLRKASDYMGHTPVCRSDRVYRNFKTYDCDCGLVELQNQIEENAK